MSKYIDGFIIPILPEKVKDYERIASIAAKIWKDHGALEYIEAVGDDLAAHGPECRSATEVIGTQAGETLIFAYIVYKSKEHRDSVNEKVMADPRMAEICPALNPERTPPFDIQRMMTGGFRVIVDA